MTLSSLASRASVLPLSLFVITILTRLPFTSKFPYHMDSAQYMLALDNFDVVAHQPHPPGYFLYVMAGRLSHLLIPDPNFALIALSITCSGLAVVFIHDLGMRMGGARAGLLAALFAITSPNFWFHGEVALNYAVEALLSATVALLCWRILREGENTLVWALAICMAITGGVRQSTAVFLLPLCIYSIKKLPVPQVAAAVIFFVIGTFAWAVPMLLITGVDAYLHSFRGLMQSAVTGGSVFSGGFARFVYYARCTYTANILSIGTGIAIIAPALYHVVRNRRMQVLFSADSLFMTVWMLPPLIFFTMIANHPDVPGFALILLPPLIIALALSLLYLGREMFRNSGQKAVDGIACIILILNSALFVIPDIPFSAKSIKNHDKYMQLLVDELKTSTDTHSAIFIRPYIYLSIWHLATSLPGSTIYSADPDSNLQGARRQVFYQYLGRIRTAESIILPEGIQQYFAVYQDTKNLTSSCGSTTTVIAEDVQIAHGPVEKISCIFPELTNLVTYAK